MGFYFLQPEDGRLLILNLPPHQRHSPCPLDCWTGGLGPLRCSSLYMTQRTHQDNGRTSVGLSYFLPVTFRTGGGGGSAFLLCSFVVCSFSSRAWGTVFSVAILESARTLESGKLGVRVPGIRIWFVTSCCGTWKKSLTTLSVNR